jgi:hypothetical protein
MKPDPATGADSRVYAACRLRKPYGCDRLAVPGRPLWSLVAEDRSAGGVRDQTGPEPPMLTRLLTGRAVTPGMSEYRMGRPSASAQLEGLGGCQESIGQHLAWAI